MSDPFFGCCPDCGRKFTLIDLAVMAVGDGWERPVTLPPIGHARDQVLVFAHGLPFMPDAFFNDPSLFTLSASLRRRPDGTFERIAAEVGGSR